MNKKSIEQHFIVYDKKRKGFVMNFDICSKLLNAISKNFKNAKGFDDLEEAQDAIQIFCDKAEFLNERINDEKNTYSRIPKYQENDFKILVREITAEVKPCNLK